MNKFLHLSKIFFKPNNILSHTFLNQLNGNSKWTNVKNLFYKFPKQNFSIPMTFKNKINMFYKHVHPDVLGSTCPNEYRTTNEKSMQELNSYMESLDKGIKTESKIIKFYIALEEKDKDEKTKTNYSTLDLKLEEIKHQTSQSNRITIQMNLQNFIDELIKKIVKLKKEANKGKSGAQEFKKDLFSNNFDVESSEADLNDRESLGRVKILKQEKLIEDFEMMQKANLLKNAVRNFETKSRKAKLAEKIDRAINNKTDFFLNRRAADPIAKQLVNNMKSFKDFRYLNLSVYPSHLIYFDENLEDIQIDEFLKRIKFDNFEGTERFSKKIEFRNIAAELCNSSSLTRLLVSHSYSINLPGYLTLPFNFEFSEFKNFYEENKTEIIRIRSRYLDENKASDKVIEELKKNFLFREIFVNESKDNLNFLNNFDDKKNYLEEAQEIHINLKKLKKILNDNFGPGNYNKNPVLNLNLNTKFQNVIIKIQTKSEIKKNNLVDSKKSEEVLDRDNLDKDLIDKDKKKTFKILEINFPIKKEEIVLSKLNESIDFDKNIKSSIEINEKNSV